MEPVATFKPANRLLRQMGTMRNLALGQPSTLPYGAQPFS
jgi:hypothetical protein